MLPNNEQIYFRPLNHAALRPSAMRIVDAYAAHDYAPNVRYVVLFGSEARGEARLTSDVDIAVVSDEPLTRAERLELESLAEGRGLLDQGVRIVNTLTQDLNSGNFMDVNYHILRDGVAIYERQTLVY